jgi:hypothetical protein
MFNPDFYPTPPEVAATMLDPLDLRGRVVAELSAGSGNLVREALARGAEEVLAAEIEPKLRAILASIPSCRLIGNDCLQITAEHVAHVDVIAINPPFSADERHILHAWAIAPPGCEVVSLANWNTVCPDRYSRYRQIDELRVLIETYGSSQNLGSVFQDAERTTRCEIGLVRMRKPRRRDDPAADEFEGFFLGPDAIEAEGQGLITYRRSRDLVNRYVEACRIFDEQLAAAVRLHGVLDGIVSTEIGMMVTMGGSAVKRNRFRKELQKDFWKVVIAEMLPREAATSQTQQDINTFVEQQSHVPFTERNLLHMLRILIGTTEQRIDRAVEAAFDALTKYTEENRWSVPGWKTNEQYLFGEKFIVPYAAQPHIMGHGLCFKQHSDPGRSVSDLIKALCYITGRKYEDVEKPLKGFDRLEPGAWYEWGFFDFKLYKKGTAHFRFRDLDDWAALNGRIGKIKGLTLPEQMKHPKRKAKSR